jgi:hypothetical protein
MFSSPPLRHFFQIGGQMSRLQRLTVTTQGQMELLAQEYNFNAMVDENAGGLGGFTW